MQNLQPIVIALNEKQFLLKENYIYRYQLKDVPIQFEITIPAGFIFDGASIPRFFWSLIGLYPGGIMLASSLVHDYIYHYKGKLPEGTYSWDHIHDPDYSNINNVWERKNADRLFFRMMKETGVNIRRSWLAFMAVRLFGWIAWRF